MTIVPDQNNEPQLSEKSKHTLDLLAQGYSAKEIAAQLNCSHKSVQRLIDRLRGKFNCRNNMHLVAMYAKGGLKAALGILTLLWGW